MASSSSDVLYPFEDAIFNEMVEALVAARAKLLGSSSTSAQLGSSPLRLPPAPEIPKRKRSRTITLADICASKKRKQEEDVGKNKGSAIAMKKKKKTDPIPPKFEFVSITEVAPLKLVIRREKRKISETEMGDQENASNMKRAKLVKSEPKAEPWISSSAMRTTCALAPYFARDLPSTQCEASNHLLCC